MTAKSEPSRFLWQKAGTQPPHIAGPLCLSGQHTTETFTLKSHDSGTIFVDKSTIRNFQLSPIKTN